MEGKYETHALNGLSLKLQGQTLRIAESFGDRPCKSSSSDTVEGCIIGNAVERRSAYAKASVFAEATPAALCAMAGKMVGKMRRTR